MSNSSGSSKGPPGSSSSSSGRQLHPQQQEGGGTGGGPAGNRTQKDFSITAGLVTSSVFTFSQGLKLRQGVATEIER